jgi:hypothetical protein
MANELKWFENLRERDDSRNQDMHWNILLKQMFDKFALRFSI